MNIRELRAEAPDWSWTAERSGWGWSYQGTRGAERVRVYSVAILCGPAEDDYATQWRVADSASSGSVSYAAWWMRQSAGRANGGLA